MVCVILFSTFFKTIEGPKELWITWVITSAFTVLEGKAEKLLKHKSCCLSELRACVPQPLENSLRHFWKDGLHRGM